MNATTYGAKPLPPVNTTSADTPAPVVEDTSKGFTVLLIGGIGTGKTTSLKSLIAQGITPCVIGLEPGIEAILGDLPKGSYHLVNILPGHEDWKKLLSTAQLIQNSSLKAIAEMGDIRKKDFPQYIDIIQACANFKCEITGKELGPVDSWGTDRALCIDTLSGFNKICMNFVIGAKPVASMLDWQAAQKMNMTFLETVLNSCRCHVVVNAHTEREPDEVVGGTKVTAASLGKKLAPILLRDFDNVLMADFGSDGVPVWSSLPGKADLKSRHLPRSDKLKADYAQLVAAWKAKGGVITQTQPKV
jgi:hypothetical protein